jgi:glycosyltransferase involved in cell wall biosynthesis
MKVLLLNQAFHPDVVSTAQYLTDLALALADERHEVTVLTGRHGYDDPLRRFPAREVWQGIEIRRVGALRMGKTTRWRRAIDFGTYMASCGWQLARLPRFDGVLALTSPPLVSAAGAAFVRAKGGRFVFWVMDLNPDEAVAAGWLQANSIVARALDRVLRYCVRRADAVIALDRFMSERLVARGAAAERVVTLPPWSHDDVRFDAAGRERFRRDHGLDGRFVVMYAGNHSPCNPLETLLEAAHRLRDDWRIAFCFVGGGSRFAAVEDFASSRRLKNITCVPYRPRAELAAALSAGDLHAVTMGDPFVGILHPCKIYNVLTVGAPVLYVGPEQSHIGDISAVLPPRTLHHVVHGDVDRAVAAIRACAAGDTASRMSVVNAAQRFGRDAVLPDLVRVITAGRTTRGPLARVAV